MCETTRASSKKSRSHQFQTQVSKPKNTQQNLTWLLFMEIWFIWSRVIEKGYLIGLSGVEG